MNSPMAFRATYADWKLIKTRGVVQVVMEVPLADSDAAYDVLGGMPNSANESWFAIAPLTIPPAAKESKPDSVSVKPLPESDKPLAGAKRDWRDMPPQQRAGMRISEATFAAYLREEHPDEWHETGEADACLKFICKIDSKRDLATNHKALTMFNLLDTSYLGWLAKERVGA